MSLLQCSFPLAEQPVALDALHVRERDGFYRPASSSEVVHHARRLLSRQVRRGATISSPQALRDFLTVQLAALEHEVFIVVLLDAQHRLIAVRELFRGTLTQTSVYPREVVKVSLLTNAAAVILAHNHPSGAPEPSRADEFLTQSLKSALALVDVQVLDHLVIAAEGSVSFAERGLI